VTGVAKDTVPAQAAEEHAGGHARGERPPISREQREAETTFGWFTPVRKRASLYEDVTLDTTHSIERHFRWGYQIAFADGRPTYWDASKAHSSSWWEFRDPGELWERNWYQTAAHYHREVSSATAVAKADNLYSQFEPEWTAFLRDQLQAIAQAEYGLVMPMANAVRPSRGDCQLNCISFHGGYKLRHAEALTLYGMELDDALGGFAPERGTESFLKNPAWQPVRSYLERLNLVHDWVEIVVAANIVFEPLIGVLLRRDLLMNAASASRDLVTPVFGRVAQAEWKWGRAWSTAFVADLAQDPQYGEENRELISGWVEEWGALAEGALDALGELVGRLPGTDFAGTRARLHAEYASIIEQCQLSNTNQEVVA
jgi:propane monooxygenase small subunit